MAKGRKLPSSRSERFLGSLSYNHSHVTVNGAAEFGEADVWSVGDDAAYTGDGGYGGFHPPPRSGNHHHNPLGGLSLAFDASGGGTASSPRIVRQYRTQDGASSETSSRGRHVANSAPVNVPDWSKIYRVNSVESLPDSDDGWNESEVVPPHEYLAREYARSQRMAANSVFVGMGRTLKGRDLSRVRDAVWSQTGFDG